MGVNSPITSTSEVVLECEFDVARVVELYEENLGLNVQRYFDGMAKLPLYRCLKTSYRFFHPPSLAGDESLYRHLQHYSWYYSEWRWEHEIALSHLSTDVQLLEVGCGEGHFLTRAREQNVQVEGLELNELAISECKKKGLKVYPLTIQDISKVKENIFDVICAFQVLEHLYQVNSFMLAAARLLKPGGKLIVSVPNNNPYLYRYDKYSLLNLPPHHMGLWDALAIEKMGDVLGFDVENIKTAPLESHDYDRYFLLYLNEHYSTWFPSFRARAWLATTISYIRKKLNTFIEGRDLIAVYRKPGID